MQKFLHQLIGETVTAEMADSKVIYGKVRSVSEDTLVLETEDGEWAIRLMHITAAHHRKEQTEAASVQTSVPISVPKETNSLVVPALNSMGNSGMTIF